MVMPKPKGLYTSCLICVTSVYLFKSGRSRISGDLRTTENTGTTMYIQFVSCPSSNEEVFSCQQDGFGPFASASSSSVSKNHPIQPRFPNGSIAHASASLSRLIFICELMTSLTKRIRIGTQLPIVATVVHRCVQTC